MSRDDSWRHRLISELDSLGTRFDAVVLDTGAGWVESRRGFATEAQDIVVVVSPDPTALSDAYGTVRALTERCGVRDVLVLANQVAGARDGSRAMQRLQAMCSRLTDVRLHDLGSIPFDPLVRRAGMRRRPVSLAYPGAPASRALDRAADLYLDARPVPRPLDSTLSSTPHTPAFAGATQ